MPGWSGSFPGGCLALRSAQPQTALDPSSLRAIFDASPSKQHTSQPSTTQPIEPVKSIHRRIVLADQLADK